MNEDTIDEWRLRRYRRINARLIEVLTELDYRMRDPLMWSPSHGVFLAYGPSVRNLCGTDEIEDELRRVFHHLLADEELPEPVESFGWYHVRDWEGVEGRTLRDIRILLRKARLHVEERERKMLQLVALQAKAREQQKMTETQMAAMEAFTKWANVHTQAKEAEIAAAREFWALVDGIVGELMSGTSTHRVLKS